jgi:anti-sigma factor RsiW
MNETHYNRPESDELDWLAYCYLSDELHGDERSTFENRLADDQAAREALARSVELMQAIAVAEAHEGQRPVPAAVIRRTTTWPRRLAWMSLGASAALVIVAVWVQFDSITALFVPAPVDRRELAEVWSQTRETVRDIVQSEPYEYPTPMEADPSSDESLPSWISAAVFNQSAIDSDLERSSTHDES